MSTKAKKAKRIFTVDSVEDASKKAGLLGSDVWETEDGSRGEGRLRLRASPHGGIAYFFRYSRDGKQYQLRINKEGLAEARLEADRLSLLYRDGIHDLHQHARLEAMATQARLAVEAAQLDVLKRAEEARAKQGTLGQLLDGYVSDLERRGRVSAKEVKGSLKLNVLTPFPALVAKPAKEIEPSDITSFLRHCLTRPVASKGRGKHLTPASATNGKKRQTAKLRSYLQAAFAFGLTSDNDAQQDAGAAVFGLTSNPVLSVKAIEGANRAETWALTKDELKAVLLALEDLPERRRAIAKAMLYLAGQRVEMLCRVTWADLYDDGERGGVMQLLDLKGGKGTPPRIHLLPMTERLSEIMAPLLALQGSDAPGPFSLRGKVNITPGTALGIFGALGDALSAAGKARRFGWRHMRATVETHLASLGMDRERRAWLLSHGRSGVQAKHYDRYSYLPEKRQDLEKWARYLDQLVSGETAKVVQLHA
ncbi:tyrosine-type recombinase/integrase [Pseudomonas sp. H11T01]|uniref:tyrosine-type recombinase/integrase n=1 Tax=Pseudomonas sp. H11T01 TaxID=3402749 RepID=UPI003ACF4861